MSAAQWQHFPHEADVGVRGVGESLEEAFEQAAVALTAVITDPEGVEPREAVSITCKAPDRERNMLFSRFEVTIRDGRLRGTAWGEPVDRARHRPAVEVKGATYTGLHVGRRDDGLWVAECVVDV